MGTARVEETKSACQQSRPKRITLFTNAEESEQDFHKQDIREENNLPEQQQQNPNRWSILRFESLLESLGNKTIPETTLQHPDQDQRKTKK